jgi:hypothetical protein
MRKLFAVVLLVALPLFANEVSVHTLQSGSQFGPMPLFDHGLHGEGQIIAILDTGLDWDNCFFAEADGSAPPYNLRVTDTAVNPARRKVIAYDFLYSCVAFPSASGCDDPSNPLAFDNQGHGTHAAASAAADRGAPIAHDYGDAIATGAKLIVQDAGYTGGDNCSQRPGIGCPANLTPILAQAYAQGARIHSNSWGDRQGVPYPLPPPTANYSQSARDVDAFVYAHPDLLVVFNTGNYGTTAAPPASTLSAPGCAKNTLQVGGTRMAQHTDDDVIASYSLVGPTRDGRIKPDIVGPAEVLGGDSDLKIGTNNCNMTFQSGTSWSSPTIAGAAALVRQYFTDGYYPSGAPAASDRFTPSAALLKATIIAAARSVPYVWENGTKPTTPAPSYQQGFGFPVLGDVLYFPGNAARLRVADVASGLAQGETASSTIAVRAGTPLKVVLVWTDPPGTVRGPADTTPQLINDLDLRVTGPAGATIFGNDALHAGQPDRLNNVEVVSIPAPAAGNYTVSVNAAHITAGPRQNYALVITGDITDAPKARMRAARH